jgi:hypothetical protein
MKLNLPQKRLLTPLYRNKGSSIALYKNTDPVLDLGPVLNETLQLTQISVIPVQPEKVYKTTAFGITISAVSGLTETNIDALISNGSSFLKELDIYYQPKEVYAYCLTPFAPSPNRVVSIKIELRDVESLSNIRHLFEHPDIYKIYVKRGKELSEVSTAYLNTLISSNIDAIVLELHVTLDSFSTRKILNLLLLEVSRTIKRVSNIYSNIYEYSAVKYGKDIFTPLYSLSQLAEYNLKYIVNSDYIYLI